MDEILADLAEGKFVIQQVKAAYGWCDYCTIRTPEEAWAAVRDCEKKPDTFRIVSDGWHEVYVGDSS